MGAAGALRHPALAGAVMVLAVNDAVLKDRYGNWWTGKASDFAGVFVVALLAGLVLRRPRLGAALTAVGFVGLKLSTAIAMAAAPILGGVTRQDPTDLIAIAMVVPAVRLAERRLAPQTAEASVAQLALRVLGGATALLAVTATSCAQDPGPDGFVVDDAGSVMARLVDSSGVHTWAVSTDGGSSWRSSEAPRQGQVASGESLRACSDTLGCFRTTDDSVERRLDGDWREEFSFTADEKKRYDLRTGGCGDPFSAITVVDRPDGDFVLVAMGSHGILQRTPNDEWIPRAVLDHGPSFRDDPLWLHRLGFVAPGVVILLAPLVLTIGWWRRRWTNGIVALMIAGLGGGWALMMFAALSFFGSDFTVAGPATALLAVMVFVASLVAALRGRRTPQDNFG